MEWIGVLTWALVVALALPLAALGGLTAVSLGLQSLFALGGFTFCLLYIAMDGGRWLAWSSAGLALAGAAAVAVGAARLASDEPRKYSAGQAAEEHAAALAGLALPFLCALVFVMALAAVGVTTVD